MRAEPVPARSLRRCRYCPALVAFVGRMPWSVAPADNGLWLPLRRHSMDCPGVNSRPSGA